MSIQVAGKGTVDYVPAESLGLPPSNKYEFIDVPVVDGVATLPDGRTVRTSAKIVRIPVLSEKEGPA